MFAIESMSMGRPVIAYIDDRLYDLYKSNNHYNDDDFPIIRSNTQKLLVNLRYILNNRHELKSISKLSRKYVVNLHSIDYMSVVFKKIFRELNNENRK